MFDIAFGIAEQHAETFRGAVQDAFGASIISDVLDPIQKEIGLLRAFHEDFLRCSSSIEQLLQEARSFKLD